LNHSLFTGNFIYPGLDAGNYNLILQDHNGCTSEEFIEIYEPELWSISLGPDTMVPYGSMLTLVPDISGTPPGELQFSWSDEECENCISRHIDVTASTEYGVLVMDENGCTSQDEIRVNVYIDRDLYVPNIFSPNGDQINDLFTINSGTGLQEIESLTIFDRWGNLIFEEFHFQPDDPARSWDGQMKGKPLNPGVYAYRLTVVYKDLRRENRFGDVTLIR
jgi:gliding motility-associated-like protein